VNHGIGAERHTKVDFGDFREDDDDFSDEGFEIEILG
jgi:hypothetical protein